MSESGDVGDCEELDSLSVIDNGSGGVGLLPLGLELKFPIVGHGTGRSLSQERVRTPACATKV